MVLNVFAVLSRILGETGVLSSGITSVKYRPVPLLYFVEKTDKFDLFWLSYSGCERVSDYLTDKINLLWTSLFSASEWKLKNSPCQLICSLLLYDM